MSKKSSKQFKNQEEVTYDNILLNDESEDSDLAVSPPIVEKGSSSKGPKNKKAKCSKSSRNDKPSKRKLQTSSDDSDAGNSNPVLRNFNPNSVVKPIKVKSALLDGFIHKVVDVYQNQAIQLRKKQASEEKELRTKFLNAIDMEMEKWKEDMNRVMEEEEKLAQMLQQHLKITEKAKKSAVIRKKNMVEIGKVFEQHKDELAGKHVEEIQTSMESTMKDISELQKKVIADLQKQQLDSMTKVLTKTLLGEEDTNTTQDDIRQRHY